MMSKWTNKNIPDLTGKIAIVTGANSGLGFYTTLELAKHHCTVVMACRDKFKAQIAQEKILRLVPNAQIMIELVDLASLDSFRLFAENFQTRFSKLSLLVNNAGVMDIPYQKTQDNFERQFATNYLGAFALTGRLFSSLQAEPHARVVMVSSFYHRIGKIDFDNLQGEKKYNAKLAYSNSKLADVMFAIELNRRLQLANSSLISVAAHPGYSDTHLQFVGPNIEKKWLKKLWFKVGNALIAQSAAKGAWPLLYAACAPNVKGGEFYGPDGLWGLRGNPQKIQGAKKAYDEKIAKKLWEVSIELTGVNFLGI